MPAPSMRTHLLASLLLAFLSTSGEAAMRCYSDQDYPALGAIVALPDGYRIVLSGKYQHHPDRRPTLTYRQGKGWQRSADQLCTDDPRQCLREEERCSPEDRDLLLATLQQQHGLNPADNDAIEVSACYQRGQQLYFGLNYYRGEGRDGRSGIGRLERSTGQVELRYPGPLQGVNATHLLHDEHRLWIATGNSYECLGTVPELGLVTYDWEKDELNSGRENGMCGFAIRGLLQQGSQLVVASDTGLSIRTESTEGRANWQHWLPTPGSKTLMHTTTCEALHRTLLRTVNRQRDEGGNWSSFEQLFDVLVKQNPRLLMPYVLRGLEAKHQQEQPRSRPQPQ